MRDLSLAAARGHAKLPDRWKPPEPVDLELHDWLMFRRDKTYAHTDPESGRRSVDAGGMLGDWPLYAEEYRPIDPEKRPLTLSLCQRQRDRFRAERSRLEKNL